MGKHPKIKTCGMTNVSVDDAIKANSTVNHIISTKLIQDSGKLMTINIVFHIMFPLNYVLKQTDQTLAKNDVVAIIDALNRDYQNNAFVASGDLNSNRYNSVCPTVQQYKNMLALSASANIKFVCNRIIFANLKKAIPNDTNTAVKNTVIKGASLPVNPDKNLNIWLVNNMGGGILGYSVFPWDKSSRSMYDGVVLERKVSGMTAAKGYEQFGLNRTATHEVGHWAGLYHTFQTWTGTSKPDINALIDADKNNIIDVGESTYDCVNDTPVQLVPTYNNPFITKSWPYTFIDGNNNPIASNPKSGTWQCSQSDTTGKAKAWTMFTNYMDYTDDTAMFMFTKDQCNKMRISLLALRPAVISQ